MALLGAYARPTFPPLPGRHLPGRNGAVNRSHLAREVQCSERQLGVRCWQQIEEAAHDLGIDDRSYLRTDVRGRLDGKPWLGRIAYEDVELLARLLQTACYIVVAYLSGMRDSEVKHLQRGCLTVLRDNTGRPYRRRVTGQAFKGESTPMGVEATWVVGEPVEQAIQVLERLQPPDQPLLFALPASSLWASRTRAPGAKTTSQTNDDLVRFIGWVNDYCNAHNLPDRIPLVNGRPWRPSTSQFRRTLAWFIARRPGGAIAGAIAYHHQRVQMFEGYAGASASGFRAEVEAEETLERGERLLAMVEDHQHQRPRGRRGRGPSGTVRPAGPLQRHRGHRPTAPAADHAPPRPERLPRRVRHLRLQPRQGTVSSRRHAQRSGISIGRLPAHGLPQRRPDRRQPGRLAATPRPPRPGPQR